VVFAVRLDYFRAFKDVDLSEGGFPDYSGEHEAGESAKPETKVIMLLKTDFYQSLILPDGSPVREGV
jgi:hypothetical protein